MHYPRECYDTWKLMTPEEYREYLSGEKEEEEDDDAECE